MIDIMKLHLFKAPLAWALLLSVAGCSGFSSELPPTATAGLDGYNSTPDHIGQFYVNDQWGGNIYAYSGGGSYVCCLVYPRKWHEGLTAKVRWTTSSSNPADPIHQTWHEKVVPIEKYEQTGTRLNVHFLPNEEVRLIIWNGFAGGSNYPGPDVPKAPADWPPWKHAARPNH